MDLAIDPPLRKVEPKIVILDTLMKGCIWLNLF